MRNASVGSLVDLDKAEERISELQDTSKEFLKTEKQREQSKNKQINKKTEHNIQGLWDNYKRYNRLIIIILKEQIKNQRNI